MSRKRNIGIRSAQIEDIELISSFQKAMAYETENILLDEAKVLSGVKNVLYNKTVGVYYLAEYDEQVCGCMLTLYEWSDWRNANVVWLHSVYVLPAFRGKSVFRTLYNHIQSIVIENNTFAGLRLYVDKNNHNAMAVYKNLGMNNSHYELFEWLK